MLTVTKRIQPVFNNTALNAYMLLMALCRHCLACDWLHLYERYTITMLYRLKKGVTYARSTFTLILVLSLIMLSPSAIAASSPQPNNDLFTVDNRAFYVLAALLVGNIIIPIAKYFIKRRLQRKAFLASIKVTTENTLSHFGIEITEEQAVKQFNECFNEIHEQGLKNLVVNKGTHLPQLYGKPKYSWLDTSLVSSEKKLTTSTDRFWGSILKVSNA